MNAFFWIVTCAALLNYCYGFVMSMHLEGSPEVRVLVQQKREAEFRMLRVLEQLSPLQQEVSNSVAKMHLIDTKMAALVDETDKLALNNAALKAEKDNILSLPGVIAIAGRAFFDGATLGQFAEKGPMTESIRFQEWMISADKQNATTSARAQQIQRNWQQLERERADEVMSLKKLVEQLNILQGPLFNDLKPQYDELAFKLAPYQERTAQFDRQRMWASFAFWPALFFALQRQGASGKKAEPQPTPVESKVDEHPLTARQIMVALTFFAFCGAFGYFFWLGSKNANSSKWLLVGCCFFIVNQVLEDWELLTIPAERIKHPFKTAWVLFLLVSPATVLFIWLRGLVSHYLNGN